MKKLIVSAAILFLSSAFVWNNADVISQLKERIDAFNLKYKPAKIDLFFNQPKYSPGDTALVRTLYLQAADGKPITGRQIIHIELMDDKGKPVLENQILVANGYSCNTLTIPADLTPGIYKLVAYSDWMRNMDASLFFKQDFFIAGKETLEPKAEETLVRFFPEGGSLIAGVQNNLLLQFTGEFKNLMATIKSDSGLLSSVSPDSLGMAELKFIPRLQVHYYAEWKANGEVKKFDLPEVKATGFAIETAVSNGGSIKLRVEPSRSLDKTIKYFLVVIGRSGIIYSRPLDVNASNSLDLMVPEDLADGVAQAIIIDEHFNRWTERTIRVGGRMKYHAAVTLGKNVYATREAVDVKLEVRDKMGIPVQGAYTARIINRDLFGNDINLGMLSATNSIAWEQAPLDDAIVNRFLISQPYPWLDWGRLLSGTAGPPSYAPQRSLVISGQLLQLETGKPVPDSTQIMFFLRKQIFGYEVYVNSEGRFECPLLYDLSGNDDVFFSAVHKGKDINNLILRIDNQDSIRGFKASHWRAIGKEDPYGTYDFRKNLIDRSFHYFSRPSDSKDSLDDPNAAIEDELQGADLILKTSDYIVFPTMPDLIREVLRSVEYRRIGGRDVVRIYTTGKRPTNSAGPLYVIDGIFTKSASAFLNLKPADILTIKVIKDSNKLAKFGSLGVNGVILVRTKSAGRKSTIRQENTFAFSGMAPGFDEKSNHRSDVRSNPSIPDMRPCLYWNPRGILDGSGTSTMHFVTSDDVGNFLIEIKGLTADGHPFTAVEPFQVKYQEP